MSDFITVLLYVSFPVMLFAGLLASLVGIYRFVKRSGKTFRTAKPVPKKTQTSVVAKSTSGATELPTRTIAGEWFSSPDVSHLETPAFLRKQAV